MYGWASKSLREMLGNTTLMSATTGYAMLGFGAVGLISAIASHFGSFSNLSDPSNARSVSRVVTSVVFFLFIVLLVWILLRLGRILRQTRTRDPYATAAIVSASHKYYAQHPMAVLRYLLNMQMLESMYNDGIVLAILLLVRVVFYLSFDISFLSPDQSAITSLGANNTLTGIGTLAASLISAIMVRLIFPTKPNLLSDVFAKVAELEPSSRATFFDGQTLGSPRGFPVPKLSPGNSRNHSISTAGDPYSRSRAPTTASLAVEKLMGSSMPVMTSNAPAMPQPPSGPISRGSRDRSMPIMPVSSFSPIASQHQQQPQQQQQQPQHPFGSGAKSAEGVNFLQHIPYIDRDVRENSFFSQGPWTQPITHTLSTEPSALGSNAHNSVISTAENGVSGQIASAGPFALGNSNQLEQLVRSNTGEELISIEGRQDMLRQTETKNPSMLFADQDNVTQSRGQITSAYIPLSSSNIVLAPSADANEGTNLSSSIASNNTHPSGPSLHGEILQDSNPETERPDSLISSYIRADNGAPLFKSVFSNHQRTSSFVSEDYQYEPIGVPSDSNSIRNSVSRNPFEDRVATASKLSRTVDTPSVYIAEPSAAPSAMENKTDDTDEVNPNADDTKSQKGAGPILIRKGSKASIRRKNTIERRNRLNRQKSADMSENTSSNNSQELASSSVEAEEKPTSEAEQATLDRKIRLKKSRMSAFSGAVPSVESADPSRRDSATISTDSWDPRSKHASEISFDANSTYSRQQSKDQPSAIASHAQRRSPEIDAASLPSSLFKNSFSSTGRRSTDVFASISSLHTNATADVFYTPEASMAQINHSTVQGDNNWHDAIEADIVDERPSTAPTRTLSSNKHRHTLAPHEQTAASTRDRFGDMTDEAQAERGTVVGGSGLRRAQTLRKVRDSDVPVLESSMQGPSDEESTGALISALPMPTPSAFGDRVIL
ncbi:hypothetical protein GGI15_002771 [Coemansia interrupta]|uniref:Uncharacterized protein n=1 Tax=Coemansia interrupta TaxID=1126814 RepID=A0A9W8HHZ2_9FUNG|nr:hypothetical protein GGI15_002771 [Coemansia interrupta]